MSSIKEMHASKTNGSIMLFALFVLFMMEAFGVIGVASTANPIAIGLLVLVGIAFFCLMAGFIIVQPNEARVIVFFGKYIGTVTDSGFWWVNPFASKITISLRIHNHSSEQLKVNDLTGNPIEIGAVIGWKVVDTAKAAFDVHDYLDYVKIQSETAIRSLASQYPYDAHDEGKTSLRGNTNEVTDSLRKQVQERLEIAGVEVTEARISHLAYAPEIAQTMLRRQQASAVVAARQIIVDGAVGMVEMALKKLSEQKIVELDPERKASMVNNLLVALVSEKESTPIINTGTLHS
jgi:regulator of protease activity HflC (stomatin/prohibitin superfamily)